MNDLSAGELMVGISKELLLARFWPQLLGAET